MVLPLDSVGVIVTKMDIEGRQWPESEFTKACDEHLGIDEIIYSWMDKPGNDILREILQVCCKNPYDFNINSELFMRMFKIQDSNRKIMKVTSDLKSRFASYKKQLDGALKNFPENEKVDLFFDFKAFMTDEVEAAKEEMATILGFDYMGDNKYLQAGYVANMVNQIRSIMYDVRIASLQYQSDHGVSELRKCNYCGRIWAKVEGCEGETTCGNVPSTYFDIREKGVGIMSTFTFRITGGILNIAKTGERHIEKKKSSSNELTVGCKKKITWKNMQTVPVPPEFQLEQGDVNTEDILCLPKEGCGAKLASMLDDRLGYVTELPANDRNASTRAKKQKDKRKQFKL